MESTESGPTAEHLLDSVYLRRIENTVNKAVSHLHGTQVSFHSVPRHQILTVKLSLKMSFKCKVTP